MSSKRRGRGHGPRGGVGAAAGSGTAGAEGTSAAAAAVEGGVVVTPTRIAAGPLPIGVAASEDGAQHQAGAAVPSTPRNAGGRGGPGRNNVSALRRAPRSRSEPGPEPAAGAEEPVEGKASCTLAQMRRFIKSRPYVPVHELRRRFLIEGIEDEVNPMLSGDGTLYVGLPEREAGFLGELVRAGEVGCELLLDPTSPAIVGVFPMRPVARQ